MEQGKGFVWTRWTAAPLSSLWLLGSHLHPVGGEATGHWGTWRSLKFTSVPFFSLKCENFAFGLRRKLCRGLVPPVPPSAQHWCDEAVVGWGGMRNCLLLSARWLLGIFFSRFWVFVSKPHESNCITSSPRFVWKPLSAKLSCSSCSGQQWGFARRALVQKSLQLYCTVHPITFNNCWQPQSSTFHALGLFVQLQEGLVLHYSLVKSFKYHLSGALSLDSTV